MSSEERPKLRISDPRTVRAIAHPVRMALLEALEQTELQTITATQASELLGESPANCAFHLRTLAKYGFLEEAGGGRGRERPWRLAFRGFEIVPPWPDTESRVALEAAASVWLDRWLDRARTGIRRVLGHPVEWQQAAIASQRVVYLTAAEAAQLATDMHRLWDRFADRRDDPAQRPPGSLPFELVAFGYPVTDPPGSAGG
ncbi:MAG TPA: helix-turn-helix domain-containing protein [Streptosporangiaceae bacterium]|nr:helix-turn-helix domain-containing protein [Streptosporangiaceae bacterium]